MTDQLTALKKLAAKVEVGKRTPAINMVAFDENPKVSYAQGAQAWKAYNGSLDAAHSLHKAVLGDRWEWVMTSDTVDVWKTSSSAMLCERSIRQGKSHDNPARAWLLAIIKAKIQELEQ